MKKNLFICNDKNISEYLVLFNENNLKKIINGLFNKNLESYYPNDQILYDSYDYSYILSSYDLVTYLKRTFLENEIIDLSEILTLIKSNNSVMKTYKTFDSISNILIYLNYKFVSIASLKKYDSLLKMVHRKGLIKNYDSKNNFISIAENNKLVFDNLNLSLDDVKSNKIKQKIITK